MKRNNILYDIIIHPSQSIWSTTGSRIYTYQIYFPSVLVLFGIAKSIISGKTSIRSYIHGHANINILIILLGRLSMSLNEFKHKYNLIYRFVKKMNAEDIPGNVKPIMLKLYASSLKIRISDKMAQDLIQTV